MFNKYLLTNTTFLVLINIIIWVLASYYNGILHSKSPIFLQHPWHLQATYIGQHKEKFTHWRWCWEGFLTTLWTCFCWLFLCCKDSMYNNLDSVALQLTMEPSLASDHRSSYISLLRTGVQVRTTMIAGWCSLELMNLCFIGGANIKVYNWFSMATLLQNPGKILLFYQQRIFFFSWLYICSSLPGTHIIHLSIPSDFIWNKPLQSIQFIYTY